MEWISNGHHWFSDTTNPPVGWNWAVQVLTFTPLTNYASAGFDQYLTFEDYVPTKLAAMVA